MSNPSTSTLPCLFATLTEKYSEKNLKSCDTKLNQRWRRASGILVTSRISNFTNYFPELSLLIGSLENYSLCEGHYNQIISNDNFLQYLQASDLQTDSTSSSSVNTNSYKRRKNIDDSLLQPSLNDTEIQVSQYILPELERTKEKLKNLENERIDYINLLNEYKEKISELEYHNKQLMIENEMLKQWSKGLDNQQTRIELIKEIANCERKHLYDDIINLINDEERFSLDSLLGYSTSEWLSKQNPVIVEFIKTLIKHENEDLLEEQLLKCAVAVDAIYGARHRKYVSAINLAASAIKYSIAKSKAIIDLDSRFLSSGGYKKFIKWQENLAGEATPLPNGSLILAFDNEQKGVKNYLDRNYNTVVFHTVTSFLAFNFDTNDQTQTIREPWLNQKLNPLQMEELFDITPEMQRLLDQQLHEYLSIILDEVCTEKNKSTNIIDDLIAEHNTTISKKKRCNKCGKIEIENSRRKCPDCNEKLANIAEIQQEETRESILETNTTKSLYFKFYQYSANISDISPINPISITQRSFPQDGVEVPEIFIPDPLPLNPNSIENVRKVLEHIQEISGINKGKRKWIPVVCDGIPYNYAQKIKEDYPRILLIPGQLHEEMNMLKSFVELNWYVFICYLFINKLLILTS